MKTTVELVLASTCRFENFIQHYFTFRVCYPKNSGWRKILGLAPRKRTVYLSGPNSWVDVTNLPHCAVVDINEHAAVAEAAFSAIHASGKISNDVLKHAAKLWGPRLNDVLKFKKVGEYHIPSWDGINLTDHMAEATDNGWVRTNQGEQ